MTEQKYAIRAGAALIAFAVFLRLLGEGFFLPILQNKQVFSTVIFLTTGRVIRWPEPTELPDATLPPTQSTEPTTLTEPVELTEPTQPVLLPSPKPVFTGEDADAVPVLYGCDYCPDIAELMSAPLNWDLCRDEPTVLIVHTHASEAYTPTNSSEYVSDGEMLTMDDRYNVVSIGDAVQQILEAGGIRVIHDRSHHEYPSYDGAYGSARSSIASILEENPGITMVLDIHRDAVDGSILTTNALVDGLPASQLMILVGTDWAGGYHPDWQQNLSVGLKLAALLERENQGITRCVNLYPQRLNMDMTPGSLLIEVGASGDTQEMALRAAGALARGILALSSGS